MRIAAAFPPLGAIPPLFRGALACVVVAALGLAASLVLAPPPVLGAAAGSSPVLPLLPPVAALLGLLAGVLSLFAGATIASARSWPLRAAAGAPAGASAAGPPGGGSQGMPAATLMPGLQTAVEELRSLLAAERAELASFREVCGAATHDAMMVGARLAGVALDAETRLTAGVAQIEQALQQPDGVASRAAEAVLRVERALPEFAELIRRGMADPAPGPSSGGGTGLYQGSQDAAASRLASVADNVMQTFGAMMTDAAGQIAALGAVAAALRGDAVTLDTAAREVATAGAGVVLRVADAVAHADAALAQLPAASAAALAAGVEQAAQRLTEAAGSEALGLRRLERALPEFAELIRRSIDDQLSSIQAQLGQLHAELQAAQLPPIEPLANASAGAATPSAQTMADTPSDAAARNAATQTEATARLAATADSVVQTVTAVMTNAAAQIAELGLAAATLRGDAAALGTAGRDLATLGSGVVVRLGEAVAQAEAALAPLPAAADRLQTLTDVTSALDNAGREIATAGICVLARISETAAQADAAISRLPPATAAFTAAADQAAQRLTAASTAMQAERDTLEAAGRNFAAAGGDVVARLGEALARADDVVIGLPAAAATVTAAAADAAKRLAEASTGLQADGAALGAAGRQIADAGRSVVGRLDAAAKDADAAIARLPAAADAITAATGQAARTLSAASDVLRADGAALDAAARETTQSAAVLRQEAAAVLIAGQDIVAAEERALGQLEAAARGVARLAADTARIDGAMEQILAVGNEARAAVGEAAVRTEMSAAALAASACAIGGLSSEVAAQVDRLSAIGGRAERQAALLPGVAAQIGETLARLQAVSAAWPSAAVLEAVPAAAARMEEAALRVERIDALSLLLQEVVSGLPAAVQDLGVRAEAGHAAVLQTIAAQADALRSETVEAIAQQVRAAQAAAVQAAEQGREAALTPELATLSALSAQIANTVRHLEAAVADQDGAAGRMAASMAQVQQAAAAVAQAARDATAKDAAAAATPAHAGPASADLTSAEPASYEPAALAATMRHFAGVECETEVLLRQTEALAESVLAGRAPELPALLSERAPALLVGVETTIRRLHSVATALALASDGGTAHDRQVA